MSETYVKVTLRDDTPGSLTPEIARAILASHRAVKRVRAPAPGLFDEEKKWEKEEPHDPPLPVSPV